jgi:hypothetical protein
MRRRMWWWKIEGRRVLKREKVAEKEILNS